MSDSLAALYTVHLATLRERADKVLARTGYNHLLIGAGSPPTKFLDDQDYPFIVNPHFRHWLPLTNAPGSWVVYTPGSKPRLIFVQPHDYWHVVPQAPSGYWVNQFDIVTVHSTAEALPQLPTGKRAVIVPDSAKLGFAADDGLPALLDSLHWQRSHKTPYELALLRAANGIGVRAHRAAEQAFRAGASEFDTHMAYLTAARQIDAELPYASIVGINTHAAVLHYQVFDRTPPERSRSLLIDAGASVAGYGSDITRTHAAPDAWEFQALIDRVNTAQQGFVAKVRVGQSYAELHVHAHHVLAEILREQGFFRMSAESAVECGISSTFFPHGLGHMIGAEVHDVAGLQQSERGGRIEPPAGHPHLRMTRVLQPGMVVTIEPGLYFIDMLLANLRDKPFASDLDWVRIEHFKQFGGIRIEDNVVCTEGDPENLTRDAFALI
ncbi:MAG: Xaa-Pro dipeptidase [Rhodanobacter sp.]